MSDNMLQKTEKQLMTKQELYAKCRAYLLPIICVVVAITLIVFGIVLKKDYEGTFTMTELSEWSAFRLTRNAEASGERELRITISSDEELLLFNEFLQKGRNNIHAEYYLLADIVLEESWTPVELYDDFHGMDFSGNCHTISGLSVSETDIGGLFSRVGNCTIDGLTVVGNVDARICGGGIAAYVAENTVFENCASEVNVTVRSAEGESCFAGGLVGSVAAAGEENGVCFINCRNSGDVSVSSLGELDAAGGIFGGISYDPAEGSVWPGTVQFVGCKNYGKIVSPKNSARKDSVNACGGLVGAVSCAGARASEPLRMEISDCINYGYVGSIAAGGGIFGELCLSGALPVTEENEADEKTEEVPVLCRVAIERSLNYGTVEHQQSYGNALAPVATAAWAGGIAGCTNGMLALTECANYGDVNIAEAADRVMVSGILGGVLYDFAYPSAENSLGYASIYSCANYGNSNAPYLGGLVAENMGILFLADSFSVGHDAQGLCRALGNVTASFSGVEEERGGFCAFDIYNAGSETLWYDEFTPADAEQSTFATHTICQGNGAWTDDDLSGMVQALTQAQKKTPLSVIGENFYAATGSYGEQKGTSFSSNGCDLNFAKDALRGDHTAYALDLRNNPLSWGLRYHGEDSAVLALGQKLSLTLNRGGRTVGGGRVVRLMQKNESGKYEPAYQMHYAAATDTYDASGVLPGQYLLYIDGSVSAATGIEIEENWQLPEKTEGRYENYKTLELCEVEYYRPGESTPLASETVIRGGVPEPPADLPVEEGYVFLGWNTNAAAETPMDFSDQSLWDMPGMKAEPVRLYAVIVRREPVHIQVFTDGEETLVRSVELYSGSHAVAELRYVAERARYETAFAEDGDYSVYVDDADTGLTLKIRDGYGEAVLAYYTVEFFADGDSSMPLQTVSVQAGHCASKPLQLPEGVEGLVGSWRTAEGAIYDFESPVNKSLQLYAVWELTDGAEDETEASPAPDSETVPEETSPEDGGETEKDSGGETEKKETVYYLVNSELEGLTMEGKKKAAEGAAYRGVLHAEEGFMLPLGIRVVMGDDETELSVSYSADIGVFSIPGNTVTGDLTISAAAVPIVSYSVSSKITNSMLYSVGADSQMGYIGTVVPNAGYALPQKITATMGGAEFTNYTYNAVTGAIKVKAAAISGDLVFAGSAIPAMQVSEYQITASIGHGSAVVTERSADSPLELKIIPDDGYTCPQDLIVIAGNRSFTDFDYDETSGVLHIGTGKVDRVIVSGICVDRSVTVKKLGDRSTMPKTNVSDPGAAYRPKLPFSDISTEDWCYDSIRFVYEHELMNGTQNSFKPKDRMTREMLWVALARLDGEKIEGNSYAAGRSWAIRSGISDGKEGSAALTRQQFAAMLYRVAGEPSVKGSLEGFTDVSLIAGYAKNALLWAEAKGLITGYTDGSIRPTTYITREQAATILTRYCKTILGM